MKTLDFEAEVSAEGTLKIPTHVAEQLKAHQAVHVILLTDDVDEDWNRIAAEQFVQGYGDSDAIYDNI